MRVLPVNLRTNLSFGKFRDDNAREVVKNAFQAKPSMSYMQDIYDSWFQKIDECDYFEGYTEEKTRTVKGEFNNEFLKENKKNDYIMFLVNSLKEAGRLDNLSLLINVKDIHSTIKIINEVLAGINPADKVRSKNPHGDSRAEEAEAQARIDNLAK